MISNLLWMGNSGSLFEKSFYKASLFLYLPMKYHYEKTEYGKPIYGRMIEMHDDIHLFGTLFEKDGKGVILVQKRFVGKCLYWDRIDYWVANDIYLHPKFDAWFKEHATEENYPVFPVRSVMWALRMKPLPKQPWEDAF